MTKVVLLSLAQEQWHSIVSVVSHILLKTLCDHVIQTVSLAFHVHYCMSQINLPQHV